MVQKIIRLSEEVINQIKAGEVVENPASIIKELIENSLDAGSKHIRVSIRSGGQLLIEVEDDGCGMSPEDAVLSLERHATSKIKTAEDLSFLATMGFRGEALAAVASVSILELKTSDGVSGTCIKAKGGVIEEVIPCARNQGTTILVKNLFFNTPVRKKFQKSIAANTAQVTKVIETMSMAHPDVAFTYYSGDEKIYDFKKTGKKERIESLLGPFAHVGSMDRLWGLFSCPTEAKGSRRDQYLFINKRPIFSPLVAKAVQTGYGTRIAEGKFPSFALFIEIDPDKVDVNVHPQKKEVRFSHENELFSDVERLVRSMFDSQSISAPFFSNPISFEAPLPFEMPQLKIVSDVVNDQPTFSNFVYQETVKPLFVLGRFFLFEKAGLFLMDLEAARSRIFYEDFKMGTPQTQTLLFPIEIQEEDSQVVEDLQKMGFDCRWIGNKKLAIDSLPSFLDSSELLSFYHSWRDGKTIDQALGKFTKSSKRNYNTEQAMHIWRTLQSCRDCVYDPLGKKIWKKIESEDLDEWLQIQSSVKRS